MEREITEKDFIYDGVILAPHTYGYYMLKDNFPELYLILEDFQWGTTKKDTGWRIYFTFREKGKVYYSKLLEYRDKMEKFIRSLPQLCRTNYVYVYMPFDNYDQGVIDTENVDYFEVQIDKPKPHLMMRDFNRVDYIGYFKRHNLYQYKEETNNKGE